MAWYAGNSILLQDVSQLASKAFSLPGFLDEALLDVSAGNLGSHFLWDMEPSHSLRHFAGRMRSLFPAEMRSRASISSASSCGCSFHYHNHIKGMKSEPHIRQSFCLHPPSGS